MADFGGDGEAGSREKLEAYLAKVSEVGTEPEAWDIICKGVSSMLERKGLDYPVHETEVMGLLYADAHRKGKSLFYGEEAHHARIVEAFEERAGLARDMASDLLDEIRFRRAEGKPSSGGKSFPGDKLMGALSEMPLREETKRVRLGRLGADVMEWLADEGFRLKLLTDHIRSIGKWRVTDEIDLYKLSTLVPGKVQYQRDKFRHDIGKPLEMTLRSIIDKTGLKVNDVELYLMAKHMPERSEWMFSRAVIERMIESGMAYVNRSLGMLESISKEERQEMAGRLADSVKSHEELSGMELYALYCKNRVSSLYERERARKQGESWDSEYRCHICNAGPLMDF